MSQDANETKKEQKALDPIAEISLMAEKAKEICDSEEAAKAFAKNEDVQLIKNLNYLADWATETSKILIKILCSRCIEEAFTKGENIQTALEELIKELGIEGKIISFSIPL